MNAGWVNMTIPSQVTFQGLEPQADLEAQVLDRIAWLEKFYQGILSCRVVLDVPHRHRRTGRHLQVRVELAVPRGEPIVINHHPSSHGPLKATQAEAHLKRSETDGAHRHPHVAIHEAFDVARRRLQNFARRQRGNVKTHEPPASS